MTYYLRRVKLELIYLKLRERKVREPQRIKCVNYILIIL